MGKISKAIWFIITQTVFKFTFGHIGKKTLINRPLQIDNGKGIYLESGVYISQYAWLMGSKKKKSLWIKSGTAIGHFSHIISKESVVIEENVLIADKVFISDCTHRYDDIESPVMYQEVDALSPVIVGKDSWIGENVCIYGASIGKHCVIGANSVVKNDIPDYCVAVGCPAKVVKQYDFQSKKWIKVQQ